MGPARRAGDIFPWYGVASLKGFHTVRVPQKKLITTGPFAVVLHPLYTSVALLVFPGLALVVDSWMAAAVGVVLYVSTRIFAPAEEKILMKVFPSEYPAYRKKVLLPWL